MGLTSLTGSMAAKKTKTKAKRKPAAKAAPKVAKKRGKLSAKQSSKKTKRRSGGGSGGGTASEPSLGRARYAKDILGGETSRYEADEDDGDDFSNSPPPGATNE